MFERVTQPRHPDKENEIAKAYKWYTIYNLITDTIIISGMFASYYWITKNTGEYCNAAWIFLIFLLLGIKNYKKWRKDE